MKDRAPYQAIVGSPEYFILKRVGDEIMKKYLQELKVEKSSFKSLNNLVRYETANSILGEFFNMLEDRANGKG